jgi:hypothetical protein
MKDSICYKLKNTEADKIYSLRVFTYKLNCILIVSMLMTFASITEVTASNAASVSPAQGLFQRLIKIKYSSELYLIIKTKEAAKLNKPEIVDSALALYNIIRWKLDGLVYQLSGDLVAANSPKLLRRLDFQTLESIEAICTIYLPSFSLINEMPSEESQQGTRNINLTTNVFYLIKDSYSLIKGLSDLKTQKTMALVDILDQMRLTSPQELLKQVK